MKKLLLSVFFFACIVPIMAQNHFFPTGQGAELTYKHYDGKGREIVHKKRDPKWTKFTVENVWPGENGDMVINIRISDRYLENLNPDLYEAAYIDAMYYGDVKIEGDSVIFDNMHGLLFRALKGVPLKNKDYASVTIRMDAAFIMPRELHVGLALPDKTVLNAIIIRKFSAAKIQQLDDFFSTAKALGFPSQKIASGSEYTYNKKVSATIMNWRVEEWETIKTPAGTFECFKITYDIREEGYYYPTAPQPGFINIISFAEWLSPQIGLVKREEYINKRKVGETMLLNSYVIPE